MPLVPFRPVPFDQVPETPSVPHRWAETSGWAPPLARFQRWYVGQVFNAACTDEVVYRRLMEVMHFIVPPTRLFAPRIMARLWAAHREARGALQLPAGCPDPVDFSLSSPLHQTGY